MKILCVNQFFYPDSHGGVETVTHETTTRLAARGHDVTLVGQRTRPGTPDTERLQGVAIHRYGAAESRGRFGGRTLDALRCPRPVIGRLLRENDFDVVLPHHYFPYYAYLGVAGGEPIPAVMTFHASYWQELRLEGVERGVWKPLESLLFGGLARRTETRCLRHAARVVVLSDFSKEQLLSYYPFAERKVAKIPGGVDLERFRPAADRDAVRSELGLPLDRQVIFTVRRLVPRMGLENLMVAFEQVHRDFPHALLAIAGRGRLEADLRRQAAALGIDDALRFVGFVDDDDLVRYYQAADLFALPSLAFEGFGMVTLEALSCGTPAIGTPIGATPEILRPLAPQLIFAGANPPAIRRGLASMLEWLTDRNAAARLRERCRSYVEDRYGWDRAVDAIEALVEDVVGRTRDA